MDFGLKLTLVHTGASLAAVLVGLDVIRRLISHGDEQALAISFLGAIGATAVMGFLLPIQSVRPTILLAFLCGVFVLVILYARLRASLEDLWRPIHVVGIIGLLYLNSLALVLQSFQKAVPGLR